MFFKDFVTWLDGQPFVLFGCAFFGAWVFMDIIDACRHPYDYDSKRINLSFRGRLSPRPGRLDRANIRE